MNYFTLKYDRHGRLTSYLPTLPRVKYVKNYNSCYPAFCLLKYAFHFPTYCYFLEYLFNRSTIIEFVLESSRL